MATINSPTNIDKNPQKTCRAFWVPSSLNSSTASQAVGPGGIFSHILCHNLLLNGLHVPNAKAPAAFRAPRRCDADVHESVEHQAGVRHAPPGWSKVIGVEIEQFLKLISKQSTMNSNEPRSVEVEFLLVQHDAGASNILADSGHV